MSFIDWSDPEGMFGLLVEYGAGELGEAASPSRRSFLSGLKRELDGLEDRFGDLPLVEGIAALRAIHESIDSSFANDPVVQHVVDCIAELERVHRTAP